MAKYTVTTIVPEKKFLTFEEAVAYAETILGTSPEAIIDVTNDRG